MKKQIAAILCAGALAAVGGCNDEPEVEEVETTETATGEEVVTEYEAESGETDVELDEGDMDIETEDAELEYEED